MKDRETAVEIPGYRSWARPGKPILGRNVLERGMTLHGLWLEWGGPVVEMECACSCRPRRTASHDTRRPADLYQSIPATTECRGEYINRKTQKVVRCPAISQSAGRGVWREPACQLFRRSAAPDASNGVIHP